LTIAGLFDFRRRRCGSKLLKTAFADEYILPIQATPTLAIVLLIGAAGFFIADADHGAMRRMLASDHFTELTTPAFGDGMVPAPSGIAIGPNGGIFVADGPIKQR
jgi:hypothetical protein